MFSQKLQNLITALTCLPSIGEKTAQRMAIHLLQNNRTGGVEIANTLKDAMMGINNCHICRNLSDTEECQICADSYRDETVLCLVEGPLDVIAIEQSTNFRGKYFVLMGHLSPLDGIGPAQIGLDLLESRLKEGLIAELILATNITVEGDATAYYIADLARKYQVKTTRIAFGVPMGGELEYIDKNTLGHAFSSRTEL